jgi:hypothetical protein
MSLAITKALGHPITWLGGSMKLSCMRWDFDRPGIRRALVEIADGVPRDETGAPMECAPFPTPTGRFSLGETDGHVWFSRRTGLRILVSDRALAEIAGAEKILAEAQKVGDT